MFSLCLRGFLQNVDRHYKPGPASLRHVLHSPKLSLRIDAPKHQQSILGLVVLVVYVLNNTSGPAVVVIRYCYNYTAG